MKTSKSIQLNETLHTQLKAYCNVNGLKLQSFVEKLIENELSKDLRSNRRTSAKRK
jgi:hypothetical protein